MHEGATSSGGAPYPPRRCVGSWLPVDFTDSVSFQITCPAWKKSLYILLVVLTTVSQVYPLFFFRAIFLTGLGRQAPHGTPKAPYQASNHATLEGKRPFSEVYYEWSSGDEDTAGQEETKGVTTGRIHEGNQLIPPVEAMRLFYWKSRTVIFARINDNMKLDHRRRVLPRPSVLAIGW